MLSCLPFPSGRQIPTFRLNLFIQWSFRVCKITLKGPTKTLERLQSARLIRQYYLTVETFSLYVYRVIYSIPLQRAFIEKGIECWEVWTHLFH